MPCWSCGTGLDSDRCLALKCSLEVIALWGGGGMVTGIASSEMVLMSVDFLILFGLVESYQESSVNLKGVEN